MQTSFGRNTIFYDSQGKSTNNQLTSSFHACKFTQESHLALHKPRKSRTFRWNFRKHTRTFRGKPWHLQQHDRGKCVVVTGGVLTKQTQNKQSADFDSCTSGESHPVQRMKFLINCDHRPAASKQNGRRFACFGVISWKFVKSRENMESNEPVLAKEAVLQESSKLPSGTPTVQGYDWNQGLDYGALFQSYLHSGFQATNLGKAIEEVRKMVRKRFFKNILLNGLNFAHIFFFYFKQVCLNLTSTPRSTLL